MQSRKWFFQVGRCVAVAACRLLSVPGLARQSDHPRHLTRFGLTRGPTECTAEELETLSSNAIYTGQSSNVELQNRMKDTLSLEPHA
jgi:hypothetical protein